METHQGPPGLHRRPVQDGPPLSGGRHLPAAGPEDGRLSLPPRRQRGTLAQLPLARAGYHCLDTTRDPVEALTWMLVAQRLGVAPLQSLGAQSYGKGLTGPPGTRGRNGAGDLPFCVSPSTSGSRPGTFPAHGTLLEPLNPMVFPRPWWIGTRLDIFAGGHRPLGDHP